MIKPNLFLSTKNRFPNFNFMNNIKRFRIILVLIALLGSIIVFAKISSKVNDFTPADDFPRDAMIYVQFQDLPALIKLWKDSQISRKYLASTNFSEFQKNHLALKLVERANEIYDSINIFPNLELLSNLSETRAAAAVYDIGKMELVFIAPMSDEKILASAFFQSIANFEEIKLDDETTVFTREIEVDRARQKQKLLFTNFRGRFILATSEKRFLQTLENIKAKTPKNRLSAEPSFKQLAEKTKPNLATIWLDQKKLNEDWYFKHYWLMSETESLKKLHAGMFDFELRDNKLVERRVFLTTVNQSTGKINNEIARRLGGLIPQNVAFVSFETFKKDDLEKLVSSTFFDLGKTAETSQTLQSKEVYYFDDWGKSYGYSNLDSDFDEQFNEIEEPIGNISPNILAGKTSNDLSKIINQAQPQVSLKIFSPRTLPPPLFFETRKALVITLQEPAQLNRESFEATISKMAQNLFTVNNPNTDFIWEDFSPDFNSARQMPMPSLGWKIFYVLRQNELIFTNSKELLIDILAPKENQPSVENGFEKFTVIKFNDRQSVFDDIFKTLQNEANPSNDFFTGNIASLLDVVSNVQQIEIKQFSEKNYLFQEIGFTLKEKPE